MKIEIECVFCMKMIYIYRSF